MKKKSEFVNISNILEINKWLNNYGFPITKINHDKFLLFVDEAIYAYGYIRTRKIKWEELDSFFLKNSVNHIFENK